VKVMRTLGVALALMALLVGCSSLFSEGEPVPAKQGIVALWQSDSNPKVTVRYNADGTGRYKNDDQMIDLPFKYSFVDDDTVKADFENGNSMKYDVRTTTLYFWMSDENGTDRLHKME